MEHIGKILKQRREELGLSIDDVSSRTRLTTKHIKAIEEGDISYFRDDLSYLRFFLRSYCETLDINFDDIKDELSSSINEYTTSFTVDAIKQHRAIEKNVRDNATKLHNTSNTIKTHKKPKKAITKKRGRRRVDLSLISFIVIIMVIIISLIVAAIYYMNNNELDETPPPPVVDAPIEQEEPEPEPIPEPEEPEEVLPFGITKTSDTQYMLENLKEGEEITFEVYFGSHSLLKFLVNDQLQGEPVSKVYRFNDTITFKTSAEANKKMTLSFGYMQNNRIKVNGIDVELSNSVNTNKSATLDFTVKGE